MKRDDEHEGEPLDPDEIIMPGQVARRSTSAVVRYRLQDSPLCACASKHSLWGRIVTDPREIEAIRARIARYRSRGK